jgi:hypothetical protein
LFDLDLEVAIDFTKRKLLANTAKHVAFARCGESNLYGMVDAQIAIVEGELGF